MFIKNRTSLLLMVINPEGKRWRKQGNKILIAKALIKYIGGVNNGRVNKRG